MSRYENTSIYKHNKKYSKDRKINIDKYGTTTYNKVPEDNSDMYFIAQSGDRCDNLAQRLQGVEQLEIEIGGPPREVTSVLRKIEGVVDVNHRHTADKEIYSVKANEGLDLRDEISRAVVSNGWSLLSMQLTSMSLEDIFLRLTTEEEQIS